MWNRRMLIADCKGRIETIEMRFGFDHGEELQLVKYQMSISHIMLAQSLFKGFFSFLQKHAIAIYFLSCCFIGFLLTKLHHPPCSRHHLHRFEARTFGDPHHDVEPLPHPQISKLLKFKGETLPSVTHHKKQEAKSELHSESRSLPRSLPRTHHPPDPRPTSHLFFSRPKKPPDFRPHSLSLFIAHGADEQLM